MSKENKDKKTNTKEEQLQKEKAKIGSFIYKNISNIKSLGEEFLIDGKKWAEKDDKRLDDLLTETNLSTQSDEWKEIKIESNIFKNTLTEKERNKFADFKKKIDKKKLLDKILKVLIIFNIIFVIFSLLLFTFIGLSIYIEPIKEYTQNIENEFIKEKILTDEMFKTTGIFLGVFLVLWIALGVVRAKNKKVLNALLRERNIYCYDVFFKHTISWEDLKKMLIDGTFDVTYISTKGSKKIFGNFEYPTIEHNKSLKDSGFCYEYLVNGTTLELQEVEIIENNSRYLDADFNKLSQDYNRTIMKPIIDDTIGKIRYITLDFNSKNNINKFNFPNFNIFNYLESILPEKDQYKQLRTNDNDFDLSFHLRVFDKTNNQEKETLKEALTKLKDHKFFSTKYDTESSSIWTYKNKMYAFLSYKYKESEELISQFDWKIDTFNNQFKEIKLTGFDSIEYLDEQTLISKMDILYYSLDFSRIAASIITYILKTSKPLIEFLDFYKEASDEENRN